MARSIEHNIFPDLAPRAELYEKVGFLEKSWLDQTRLSFPEQIVPLINGLHFFQIKGVQAICEEKSEKLESTGFSSNFFSGLYNQNFPLVYLIYCKNSRIKIYLGTNKTGRAALSALLNNTPGSNLYNEVKSLDTQISNSFVNCSAITGIPTPFNTRKINKKPFIWNSSADCLISGLTDKEWVFIVQAFPIQRNQTNGWLESCSREIKDIKEAFLLRDIQKFNRTATYYTEILEKSIKRLNIGKQQGIWQVGTYLFSNDRETLAQGLALLSSVYSGNKSTPEPIRSHHCSNNPSNVSPFINCYHSKELGCFISLPSREFPGFRLLEQANFDVDFESNEQNSLLIGQIMAENRTYNFPCSIPVDDLTKHGLIAGVTGSGKTNTVFHILSQLHKSYSVPFLVIEPAKSEYRNLLNEIDSMLVFTLGEERPGVSSPFRMNPFYFPDGVSLQTHIDFLKAVFNASFGMYAPMPYILEECLYKIYQDKGWNLVTSINTRGNRQTAYPTLLDLYYKIDEVVDNIGYHDRISMDIKAALKTRINNLCIGGKGMMLNTSASIPFKEIMSKPTVLELKYLGNDEEKAFMMGLILMAIWEYYESLQGSQNIGSNKLKHLLIIEEAHRLLKNVPTEKVSEEQSNIKGKGVETFCNLLAEMRAYGEGVLVSEQIPVKLAPDVIKNSNLKIMHRLVAKDDRDFMGDTMCLNAHHKREAVRLETGEAVFFREGFDRSLRVKVPVAELKQQNNLKVTRKLITDKFVRDSMQLKFFNQNKNLLMRFTSCNGCRYVETDECEKNRKYVEEFIENHNWKQICVTFFLPYLIHSDRRCASYQTDFFKSIIGGNAPAFYCMASHMISDYVNAKADYYGWSYKFAGDLIKDAQKAIKTDKSYYNTDNTDNTDNTGNTKNTDNFANIIGIRCQEAVNNGTYKFASCERYCKCRGLLCYEGNILSKDPETHNNFIDLLNSDSNSAYDDFYGELKALIVDFAGTHLVSDQQQGVDSLAICYLIQKLNEHQFSLKKQKVFLKEFINSLNRPTMESVP